MSNLKTIKTERDEYAEGCIDVLRDALKFAQENPLNGVVVLTFTRSANYNITYSTFNRIELAGAVALMGAKIAE